jgi:alpha-L-fucosidase 2
MESIWLDKPGEDWYEALPVGNGRLGGMDFGGVTHEHIQLNEDSVWYGGPLNSDNPDALKYLPKIRSLIDEGEIEEAEKLASHVLAGTPAQQRHYQTLGDLYITQFYDGVLPTANSCYDGGYPQVMFNWLAQPVKEAAFEGYRRELDFPTGIVTTSYTVDGISYKREVFASHPDQVIAVRFSAGAEGKIGFRIGICGRNYEFDGVAAENDDTLFMHGVCGGKDAAAFSCALAADHAGGRLYRLGEFLIAEDCDEATLFLAANTSFYTADHKNISRNTARKAARKGFERVKAAHLKDFAEYYGRVTLELGGRKIDKPMEQRLKDMREGERDIDLIETFFHYGRYLLISSSREHTQPANLQGIWCRDMFPPFGGKYTINCNEQQNYWPVLVCNLPECHMPLFDLMERMRENGRRTAKIMYGCRGIVAHHNTDIWGTTAPQDSLMSSTYWPQGMAWLCLHIYDHYLFTQDIEFLRDKYDIMKEACEFYLDFLTENKNGELVPYPTISPENIYFSKRGNPVSLCAGCARDNEIVRALFKAVAESAELLDLDAEFSEVLKETCRRIPELKIGKHGQIVEWDDDYEEADPTHRHFASLFALYPGYTISPETAPELSEAARRTMQRRMAVTGRHTGWSGSWALNLWARLGEKDEFEKLIYEVVGDSARPNLFTATVAHSTGRAVSKPGIYPNEFHKFPPFMIDGNTGVTAAVAEALLQSHEGIVRLLPSLPKEWASGSATGLRARGAFEVDIAWKDNRLERANIRSLCGRPLAVSYDGKLLFKGKTEKGQVIEVK